MGETKRQLLFLLNILQLSLCWYGVCIATQNRSTISITQPLSLDESLVSSLFRLKFFVLENRNDFYAGIMYDTPIPKVVWVANRERPLTDSEGTLAISEDGNLAVLNGKKEILWSSNVTESVKNSTAQLLDTGNLVLMDSNGSTIWESFQFPQNSLLQGMKLSAKANLISWRSPSDPGIGNFINGLAPLPVPQLVLWNKKKKPYWRTGPWNGRIFIGVPDMDGRFDSGYEVTDVGSESAYFTYTFSKDDGGRYYFFQLTSMGDVEELSWNSGTSKWVSHWSPLHNPCNLYGRCGPFGTCNPRETGHQICSCLPEFEPKDKEEWEKGNWTAGCTRKKPLFLCDKNNTVVQDEFKTLTNVKVPDSEKLQNCSEELCKTCCLDDCSCVAFTYAVGIGCMLWNDSLVDIQQFSTGGVELYIRVAQSEDKKKNLTAVLVSAVLIGVLFLVASAFIFWKRSAKHRGRKLDTNISLFRDGDWTERIPNNTMKQAALEELPLYSYETIANATDNFSSANKLGKGGFGQVFKGKLLDGLEIAVKRLSRSSCQGIEEFVNEVVVISKLQHRNLVRLIGCCVEREEKMLIYEFMPNRSLDAYLFDSLKRDLLDWTKRALVIEGICRGLLYLHRDSRLKIIHRDLKASNILLDENLNPKISDFGLARIVGGNQDEADTRRVVGTYGYMAPEYAMEGTFSEKSDVFSFGVLLLEIVCGRRNTSFSNDENEQCLLKYAWKLWSEGEAIKLIDPAIFDPRIESQIQRYIHVGLLCQRKTAAHANSCIFSKNVSTDLHQIRHRKFDNRFVKFSLYLSTNGVDFLPPLLAINSQSFNPFLHPKIQSASSI